MLMNDSDISMTARVQDSFSKQTAMHLIRAQLTSVRQGETEIQIPHWQGIEQQHGFVHGGIGHLLHHSRRENCIHAPAALGFGASSLGLFHGTKVSFTTDGAAGWINLIHLTTH